MVHPFYSEHQTFIESVHKLVQQELTPHLKEWEEDGNFPNHVFSTLGKQGYLGILISEEYGGIGADYKLAGAWCEAFGELASVGLTIAVNMHSLVISHGLELYGTPELKKKWLPKAVLGEAIGAYAFTEPGAGSDLARLRTKAVKQGNKWIINGSKTFITNGARADFMLVLTRTDASAGYGGFTTFLVDTKTPGFKVNRKLDKLGWRSSDTAELTFENVEVDEGCIMGKLGEGWSQAISNLNWERMMLTLTSLGGARACFREAAKYSKDRDAFGKPIGEQPVIRSYLDSMLQRILIGESLGHRALELVNLHKDCKTEVSLAKRMICDDAVWLADRAIQIHGGYGYTVEFPSERWWRDLRLMPIGGGTSEVMANIVVKELTR